MGRDQAAVPNSRPAVWVVALGIAAVAFLAFLPALSADFVTWDDDTNFTNNLAYRGLGTEQLTWMWTTFHLGHYIPLSWMTLGFDYVLWGMNPFGYHLTNQILHAANAALVFVTARRLYGAAGAFGRDATRTVVAAAVSAVLFAVHPLRAESVVWITERRDMLSLLFYLLALQAYLTAAGRDSSGRRSYQLSIALFAAALLSKATSVTFPIILLLVNVYPLRRLTRSTLTAPSARRVYRELLPFVAMSGGVSVLSIVALSPPDQLGLLEKVALSAYGFAFYLWKTIAPTGLAPLYERPQPLDLGGTAFVLSYLAVPLVLALAWRVSWRRPGVRTAWLAYCIMLFPFLGIVQNGPQLAADRYTYHASPALMLIVGAAVVSVPPAARLTARWMAALMAVVLIGATWRQIGFWQDSERLWARVLAVGESSIARTAYGNVLTRQGRVQEAIPHYERSIELDPASTEALNNLGVARASGGDLVGALVLYDRAIALRPDYYEAYNNRGVALSALGRHEDAIREFQRALAIRPQYVDAEVNWGNALVRDGRAAEALVHYEAAVRMDPRSFDAHLNLGVGLTQLGRYRDAAAEFDAALRIDPQNGAARDYAARARQLAAPVADSGR